MKDHDELPCPRRAASSRRASRRLTSGRADSLRGTAGSATAEFVVLLPAVGALILVVLAGAQGVIANAAVVDASAAAARLAARGDPVEGAVARFANSNRAVTWSERRREDFLCITVRLEPRPGVLLSFPAEAESCALAAG